MHGRPLSRLVPAFDKFQQNLHATPHFCNNHSVKSGRSRREGTVPQQSPCLFQARIALANTSLTALGIWALQIPGLGLLSMFVFICSFIPIAGCIISTVPVGFVALTEYGFLKVGLPTLRECPAVCPGKGRLPSWRVQHH